MTTRPTQTSPRSPDATGGSAVASDTADFYATLTPFRDFAGIVEPSHYAPLPDEWVIGISDVVHSTDAIAHGRYKAVNTVGAAVLTAVKNALPNLSFPFVFGGDGASFAVPGHQALVASDALARTAAWASDALGLTLRIAVIPITAIRAAGFDVRIARLAASPEVSYAMVSGGGLAWADAQLKAGRFSIAAAAPGDEPDLTGLFCGFTPIRSLRGVILSLIAVPLVDGAAFASLVSEVVALVHGSDASGRPFADLGPLPGWTGSGFERFVESRAARSRSFARVVAMSKAFRLRLAQTVGAAFADPALAHYRRQMVQNTDFRKFDDGLRMTLDCTPEVADAVEARLASAYRAGVARIGTHRQSHANLTCIVPSLLRDDHVHFVDGAAGGYASAAAMLKAADGPR